MKSYKQKKSKNNKGIIITVSIIAVIIIAALIYFVALKGTVFGWQLFGESNNTTNSSTSSDENQNSNNEDKGDSNSSNQTTDQVPISTDITAAITELSQSNGLIKFKGTTNSTQTGGKCSVTFTNSNDRPVSKTFDATLENDKAVCGVVQISETEFSYVGDWNVTFRYYTNDTQAIAEDVINIQ